MTTEFNLKQTVWFMFDNKPTQGLVKQITIYTSCSTLYSIETNINGKDIIVDYYSSKIFASKEKLLNSFRND